MSSREREYSFSGEQNQPEHPHLTVLKPGEIIPLQKTPLEKAASQELQHPLIQSEIGQALTKHELVQACQYANYIEKQAAERADQEPPGLKGFEQMLAVAERYDVPTPGEEEFYLRAIKRIDQNIAQTDNEINLTELYKIKKALFDQYVMRNSALAINIAKRYLGHGLEMQDLYQEGMQGIQKAVEKYDFRKNSTNQHNRFSTVAVHWTHQAISRALANQSRTIRVPVHMHDRMIKVYSVRNRFETMHGRLPTSEELTQETGLSLQHVEAALEASHNHLVLSLDEPVREDDGSTFGDFIPQEAPAPQETAEQALFKEQVRQMVEELPPRERDIIKLRFGIGTNKPPMNLRDIGEIFGVTKERIRQLENKTLRNLKGEATKLKDFIE